MTGRPSLRQLRRITTVLPGFGRSVATTAFYNIAATGAAGLAGLVIARSLGPAVRGEYAAIFAWFGVVLIAGQLGQTAATTYFVARDPHRAADYVATSRNLMVVSGLATLTLGLLAVPLLAPHDEAMDSGYRLMFATCLAAFVGASYTFSLLASNIPRWNLVRISQPAMFVAFIIALHLLARIHLLARPTLLTVLAALSATFVLQAVIAYLVCRAQRLTGGRGDRALARPMVRYGMSQLAASAPALAVTRLDQLVLSLAVAPAVLGHYAVAASVATLAVPVVSAVGFVAFPKLASRLLSHAGAQRLRRGALVASASAAVAMMLALAYSAAWLVPAVFGAAYRDAVPLLWLLAPGGAFLACGQVCGDLLRGHGQPLAVARAQGAAAVVMAVLLAVLLPALGIAGAAIASSAAAAVALALMLRTLRTLSTRAPAAGAGTVLLLAPSRGLGGGIERYVDTVETAFRQHQVAYRRLDYVVAGDRRVGIAGKLRFAREVVRAVRSGTEPVRLVLAHCHQLSLVRLVARLPNFADAVVLLHGSEVCSGRRIRGRGTMRRADVRVVAASSYLAGVVAETSPATVLLPGVSPAWYDTLVSAGHTVRPDPVERHLVTAFRFEAWRDKGLRTVLDAVELLDDDRVRLTVCGSGTLPADLRAAVAPHRWCRLAANLTDRELAAEFARADLFVLASCTRRGASVYGEGFGLVLLEAQLAGTPVVAPPYGGSGDAFQPYRTGLSPADETPAALAAVLATLLDDDDRRARMSQAAAAWSRASFEPTTRGEHIVRTLVGTPDPTRGRSTHQLLETP
jgi:O-antigen/teichoic acid export membrane protein/glycosyltransferase involved in cell wall biosynthesis